VNKYNLGDREMKVVIGSENKTKVGAVKEIFENQITTVIGVNVPSGVSAQPFTDEETRCGAINRARASMKCGDIGIGLEGGVDVTDDGMLLCNWGALCAGDGTIFTAAGARIFLPESIAEELKRGTELAEVMETYTAKKNVRNQEGAIGIFTNQMVNRKEMFAHVVKLLAGQYYFYKGDKHN
jgi:inosine/xanthosine triphosphatase